MLAERFSQASLADWLIPLQDYHPFPRAQERAVWEGLPSELREKLIQHGEKFINFAWPLLPAVRFMDFARDGNRSRYESLYFSRRSALGALVVAECIEGKGRFLDEIINGVWCICEESSWVVPAHNWNSRGHEPLPDTSEPFIDLFAAETGALLSWIYYLLREPLDSACDAVSKRIHREVKNRILDQYINRDFFWMGFKERVNNWCPWINSNCIAAFLLLEDDTDRRIAAIAKSLRVIDGFLKDYAPDGGCDEGPGYWNQAGGSLFDCLELLYGATNGKVNVYDEPLIAEIGRYVARMHISAEYFVNFADGDARSGRLPADLIYRYGRRVGDKPLMGLAADANRRQLRDLFYSSWFSFTRVLPAIFGWEEINGCNSTAPYLRDAWMESIQVMVAREQDGTDRGLFLAAKGGNNNESHNHNDVGQFIVYADGRPILIDAGVGTYTRKTFSSERYDIWTMQSAYHNLPTVGGTQQQAGPQFRADCVSYSSDDTIARLSMNIALAYPEPAGITKWQRVCALHRANPGFVEITDDFILDHTESDIILGLLTPCNVQTEEPGCLILEESSGVRVCVKYNAACLDTEVQTIDVNDARLSATWGDKLYRIVLRARTPVQAASWTMRVRRIN